MAYDELAAERVRRVLGETPQVTEKNMMGALTFMVAGNMCCGVTGNDLMVRIGADAAPAALDQPHVRRMEVGGRSPRAFVCVAPEGYATEAALQAWVRRGLDFVATLPAKPRS